MPMAKAGGIWTEDSQSVFPAAVPMAGTETQEAKAGGIWTEDCKAVLPSAVLPSFFTHL